MRITDRTVAEEYFAVSEKGEALYDAPRQLPADAEGTEMAELRREMHRRTIGNGYCAAPSRWTAASDVRAPAQSARFATYPSRHGIAHLKNWRCLARHLGRREHMSDIVLAIAGPLSHQQTANLIPARQM
ncbi:hypothetical protein [Streptomyces sp. NPDC046862]|uniref:hypothetical protein n=1 Tax=Streptomyces sp. NPDC046862 TaxID=3154603 RepID=UPI003454A173